MIDPNLLRNNLTEVAEKLKVKRNFILDTEKLTSLEEQRKNLQVTTENLQAERNTRSKAIGAAKARGEDIAPLLAEVDNYGQPIDRSKSTIRCGTCGNQSNCIKYSKSTSRRSAIRQR